MRTPNMACDMEEWMWGREEDATEVEARNGNETDCRPEQRNACSQHVGQGSWWCRRQGRPWFPRDMSGGSPSSGDGSSNWGSNWSSQQSTMTRASDESNWPVWPGRGLRVKVNLQIFKGKKAKDALTYHSWWLDVAIFCSSGGDDHYMLQYVFWSLQRFPDLAWSLGEDATLSDVLQMLDKHYGIVMTFDALTKELYSLKQGSGENIAEFGVCLSQQVQILQSKYPGRIQQEHVKEMKQDHFYEGLNPEYWWMLAYKVDGEHPASYSDLLLEAKKLERQAEARDPLLPKTTTTGGSNITHSQSSGNLFPSWKLKGSHTFTAQSAMWKVTKLKKTQVQRKKRPSLQQERIQEPWVSWRSRSISWVYCLFCQCGQVVLEEIS